MLAATAGQNGVSNGRFVKSPLPKHELGLFGLARNPWQLLPGAGSTYEPDMDDHHCWALRGWMQL
jgi:hypothetical protein